MSFIKETSQDILTELIKQESTTPDTTKCQEKIAARLQQLGFTTETLSFQSANGKYGVPVNNLWATYGTAPYLVFCGHTDVVPPGKESLWQYPPFSATLTDGYIHGRGAVDMKGSIAAMLVAVRDYLALKSDTYKNTADPSIETSIETGALKSDTNKNSAPTGIAFLITADEEGEADDGTRAALQELAKRQVKISQCLVGEPTCEQKLGDIIKIGRRGSLRLRLKLRGVQRHAAYLDTSENLLHRSIGFTNLLLAEKWDADITASSPGTAFNLIDISSQSAAENVTAQEVDLLCNWRYAPQLHNHIEEVKSKVAKMLKDCGFTLAAGDKELPAATFAAWTDWTISANPYYCEANKLANNLSQAIQETVKVEASFTTSGGTSDGRFFPDYGVEVAEFGPRNATIHCVDERISVTELEQLTQIYQRFLHLHFL